MNKKLPDIEDKMLTEDYELPASMKLLTEKSVMIALAALSEEEREKVTSVISSSKAFLQLANDPTNVASLSGSRGAKSLKVGAGLRLIFEESPQGIRVRDLVRIESINSYTTFKFDVFLSYSQKDKTIVHELAERLRMDGLRVWFDEWELVAGDSLNSKIEQGVAESRALVLCISKNAIGENWPEIVRHKTMFLDPGNINRRFIPLRLDDVEVDYSFRQFAYVDWHEKSEDQYAMLLAICRPSSDLQDKRTSAVLEAKLYTNAKVLLVGDSGVGKSGLAMWLTENRFEPTFSTDGLAVTRVTNEWATQWKLPHDGNKLDIEREIWLWDFAGQSDYRLIHQLFMDEAALAVLVFNPQSDNPFEGLGQWDRDLQRAARRPFKKLLVAGRCDRGGLMVSREIVERFCVERGFAGYFETSAQTGAGCNELREAIIRHIPWDEIPWTVSPHIFRLLKEEIFRLKDEGKVLLRMGELKQQLELRLSQQAWEKGSPAHQSERSGLAAYPGESFTLEELRAVIGLLAGLGVVWQLEFGDFVLLQPERINGYAAAVMRKVRAHPGELGSIREADVVEGALDYQDRQRLPRDEEQIVLRAMHHIFVDHGLCLREASEQGSLLVFPSYFKRERPAMGDYPAALVTYDFSGMLDEIYATLVVRLHHTTQFEKDQLWRFAADFKTPAGQRIGLKLTRKSEGAGELTVYCAPGVAVETQVNFIRYVHDHLKAKDPGLVRTRHYVCGHCGTPVTNHETVRKRLAAGRQEILCVDCEKQVPLWDLIEQKFASEETQATVRAMEEQSRRAIDDESRELILVGHAFAIAGEAGQIFRPTANSDWGVDGEIEFKDHQGNASGERVYLQLKSADLYLETRKDGKEIFKIKKPRHAEYWLAQKYPVMLVIRTSDGTIRWMNVTDYLRKHGKDTKQIVFAGEPFTALALWRMRDRVLSAG